VFVHLNLALVAASSLSDDLYYDIYNYFLRKKILEIEKPLLNQIHHLQHLLLIKEFGPKIDRLN